MKRLFPTLMVVMLLFLAACDNNRVYQQAYDFEESGWHMDTLPSFTFEIEDSRPKNVLLHVRNSIAYEWRNIYLTYHLQDSTGRELASELINIPLFDPKTGEPKGKGSSIYQHAVPLFENYNFPSTGTYTFTVAQYMRKTELKEILSVGLRVEEVEE